MEKLKDVLTAIIIAIIRGLTLATVVISFVGFFVFLLLMILG